MKFSGKVGNEQMNKGLNFGGNPDHGFVSGLPPNLKTCIIYVLLIVITLHYITLKLFRVA